jgi:hypothetical protein
MMSLGDLLREANRKTEAIDHYKRAADLAEPLQQANQFTQMRLERAFTELKQKELADHAKDWQERFRKAQEERGGGMNPFGGSFTVR